MPSPRDQSDRRAMPEECPSPCKTPDMCREEEGCLLGYGVPLFESDEERAAFVEAAKGTPLAATKLGDLERGHDAFWGWLRDQLSVEECEAIEHAGIHPDDWKAAAECCIRAARGEHDPRPFQTYPDLPRS